VTVHDIAGPPLWPYLPPERFRHHAPCCLAVKAHHDWACADFELTRLRREAPELPDGRYHVCHAGILECVVPVFWEEELIWMLFAGQARAEGDYAHLVRDRRTTGPASQSATLPALPEARAQSILEALRQLRARLLLWLRQAVRTEGAAPPTGNRRLRILHFLHDHHRTEIKLGDLAAHLGLSESRTSHAVGEHFGCGYARLLQRMRLSTAASLLRSSTLPVLDVCLGSGFQDLSHFHKIFRARFGMTPLQYRKSAKP